MSEITIGLIGNPNCGKTTLFNYFTGAKQKVGNWPGVTVERKTGISRHGSIEIEVVDLPGIYTLSVTSLDEQIARDYVMSGEVDRIINIIDASNLERNLYLTIQLLEMKIPVIIALNMMDIAAQKQITIDVDKLADALGCPVVPIVASRGKGIDELKDKITDGSKKEANVKVCYSDEIEKLIDLIVPAVSEKAQAKGLDPRWLSVKLIEADGMALGLAGDEAAQLLKDADESISAVMEDDPDIMIADGRYGFINGVCREAVKKTYEVSRTVSDAIDNILLNRVLGIPAFLFAMYLTFMITINIGGCFIDFFGMLFGAIFVDGLSYVLEALSMPRWLITFLAGGVGGGIQTISTFIPPIGFMFLCLSVLEDSGYMSRAAFVMDRFMRYIGLPGKSFVPLLVGFGCNVPAIMATRTLDNERDRILTVMLNPFMSCGARLPIYALFAAAFFPESGGLLVFGLYITGIVLAVMTGLILKSTVLKGEVSHFIMELPPYHLPTVRGILYHTYGRLKSFIFSAGRVLIPIFIILAFLGSLGTDGSFGNENSKKSILSAGGRTVTPLLKPMGIAEDNWPATVGIFTGILAKEAVVGTLDALYTSMADDNASGEGDEFDFYGRVKEAFASIPAAFYELGKNVIHPPGTGTGAADNIHDAAEEQKVRAKTFSSMLNYFDGKTGAAAYLLFILVYFPCMAAMTAIYRETNLMWTIFAGTYLTALAWSVATLFYQLGTFMRHPGTSIMWAVILVSAFMIFILAMKMAARKAPSEKGRTDILQAV